MTGRTFAAIVGLGLALAGAQALAHHSFSAEFDANKRATFTGAVTNVEWRNPHTWFYVDVKDDAGNVVNWGFELASPNLLLRNGWTRSSLKIGDAVTVVDRDDGRRPRRVHEAVHLHREAHVVARQRAHRVFLHRQREGCAALPMTLLRIRFLGRPRAETFAEEAFCDQDHRVIVLPFVPV
jgi:hypothetical protein